MDQLSILPNAWLLIEEDKIAAIGTMDQGYSHHAASLSHVTEVVDAHGCYVFPGFIDSHTHLVHAGTRESEFEDRIRGLSYQDIANKGGGILNSAQKLQHATEDELYQEAAQRLEAVIKMGTTALEIKSGYGLSYEAERKMLIVIKRLKQNYPISIKATFLGAHAVPRSYPSKDAYFQDVLSWLPELHAQGLVDYVDIFCEQNYFSPEQASTLMLLATSLGLKSKIHANQLAVSGGVQAAVHAGALSADHLEQIGEEEILALQSGHTLPVLLPGCSFFLGIPYAPARKLINANLPVVIASDYNPGSCPSANPHFLLSLACTQLRMTPAEAINALTINAAAALELSDQGAIAPGNRASLWLSNQMPSVAYLPYSFGSGASMVDRVMINGQWWQH